MGQSRMPVTTTGNNPGGLAAHLTLIELSVRISREERLLSGVYNVDYKVPGLQRLNLVNLPGRGPGRGQGWRGLVSLPSSLTTPLPVVTFQQFLCRGDFPRPPWLNRALASSLPRPTQCQHWQIQLVEAALISHYLGR
jgi:hypothetical protein